MSTVINTNMASLVAAKNLLGAQSRLATSVERLSSGLRINRARDDAAGLSVASSLTAQINGADQGIRNLNDAISMVQTAEGALASAGDSAQRMLSLLVQGANGTLSSDERGYLISELKALYASIDTIKTRTKFSGNPLLDGSGTGYNVQISNDANDKLTLGSTMFANIGLTSGANLGLLAPVKTAIDTLTDAASFSTAQTTIQTFITKLNGQRSELGAAQNQMEYTLSNITELSANLSSARSRVIDTDYAAETAALTRGQILQQAATAMLAQANQMPNVILTLLK